MYLTAHRVKSKRTGYVGINAFYYRHGNSWTADLLASGREFESGVLASHMLSVTDIGGNTIFSYLDVIACDNLPLEEIQTAFEKFKLNAAVRELPWDMVCDKCRFRFSLEQRLEPMWEAELHLLFASAVGALTENEAA